MGYYSRRHYERVNNSGAGDHDAAPPAEKCAVWRQLMASHPDDTAVREVCERLIREHGEDP